MEKPPKEAEIRAYAQREVERDWSFWMPIAYRLVQITKEEYDNAPPLFLLKLNTAMERRSRLEQEEYEKAKEAQGNQGK